MSRHAVIVEPGYLDYAEEKRILSPLGFRFQPIHIEDRTQLDSALPDAELVFVRDSNLNADHISKMAKTKGIVRYGIGTDNIDLEAARDAGIIVSCVREYGAEIEVADHTVALILASKRRLVARDRDIRNGAWQVGQNEPIHRLGEATLGLLGYGRIAKAVVQRMRVFGVSKIIAHDPGLESADVELVSLQELAQRSDILSLHAPAGGSNDRIINGDFLSAMPRNAILVNTARGALIDEGALLDALKKRHLQSAALDVFRTEPPLGNPFLEMDNVILSDHSAWYSEQTVAAIQAGAAEQARQIIETGQASNRVA